ncbi:hypothetical protein Mame01_29100 [Microbispora amethystogenes]|nr:hypothetical protein Mame01_29100 [Microbispora amethystogenes]
MVRRADPRHVREQGSCGLAAALDHDRVLDRREPEAGVAVLDDEDHAWAVGDVVHVTGGPGVVPAAAGRGVVRVDVGQVHDGRPGPDFPSYVASGDVAQ